MIDSQTKKLKFPIIQAPLAGCSNLPFRLVARRRGMEFCYFEMVSSNGLLHSGKKTFRLFTTIPEDKPIGVQLVGGDADVLAESAKIIEDQGFEYLDLNFGCPVRKIVSQGAGSALMADAKRSAKIFEKVLKSVKSLPVTVKIRKGFKDESGQEALEIAKIAEKCGMAAVTVHGRTQKQGYSGKADWDIIRQVKAAVKIPVIGNGDIMCAEDALRMKKLTGCDGVMVGRGSLGNPWIFSAIKALLFDHRHEPLPTMEQKLAAVLEHLELGWVYEGPTRTLLHMRTVGPWYISGVPNAARFRRELNFSKEKIEIQRIMTEALCPTSVLKPV